MKGLRSMEKRQLDLSAYRLENAKKFIKRIKEYIEVIVNKEKKGKD